MKRSSIFHRVWPSHYSALYEDAISLDNPVAVIAAAIHAMRPLHHLALGQAINIPIENLLWKFEHSSTRPAELDQSRCGLLFISPALPLGGALVAKVIAGLQTIAQQHDHPLYMTLNMEQIVSADAPYWQTVRQLKTVFDPDNIIAPGRYNLI